MRPPPAARSSGSAARQTWKVPDRFTVSVRAQSARLVWPMSPVYPPIPATLTTAVSRPSRSPAVATAARTCSGSATSASTAVTRSRPPAASPATARAEGGAVAVEGGDGGPLGQAAGGNGQADAGGGAGDEYRYGGEETGVGRAAVIVRHALRVCVHKGRLSRTVRVNRDRNDHRPARWRRICAGLKGITTRGPLRSGACRVRIKRCIKERDRHRHHARRPVNGKGEGK